MFPAIECVSHLCRETTIENYQFSEFKTLIYNLHTWSDKALKKLWIKTLPPVHKGSLEIKLTFP